METHVLGEAARSQSLTVLSEELGKRGVCGLSSVLTERVDVALRHVGFFLRTDNREPRTKQTHPLATTRPSLLAATLRIHPLCPVRLATTPPPARGPPRTSCNVIVRSSEPCLMCIRRM